MIESPTGREIDTSCPYMGECFANGGCYPAGECPPTLLDALRRSAELEHELQMTPHTDPDLEWACVLCGPVVR